MVNLIVEPEILRLVSREKVSNKRVVIHLMLRGYTEENKQILKKLSRAEPELRRCILETGEYEMDGDEVAEIHRHVAEREQRFPRGRRGHDLRITPNRAPNPSVRRLMITANSSRKPTKDWNQVVEMPDSTRPV